MRGRHLGLLATLFVVAGLTLGFVPAGHVASAVGPGATLRGVAATAGSTTKPNIVLISADDMRADDIKFMPRTQKLLGRAGITFTDALSNDPLCCPARATILSGQYAHNNGVKGNEWPYGGHRVFYENGGEKETLPVWLQRAGYNTAFVGKYLNYYGSNSPTEGSTGPRYIPPGWNDWHAAFGRVFRYYCVNLNENGRFRLHRGEYQTDLYTRISEHLISKYARSRKPFFLWTSHLAPHAGLAPSPKNMCDTAPGMPTPPAKRHEGMFSGMRLPKSPATNEADMSDKGSYMRSRRKLPLDHQLRVHESRLEALQSLDESVADTIGTLAKKNLLDKTMVVFVSDNGWLLGEHRAEKKILPYEESLTVPLLVRGPGLPAGVKRHQPVGLVDIPATALDVAGATATKPQDGVSLVGLAQNSRLYARRVMPIEAGPVPSTQRKYNTGQPPWFYQGVRSSQFSYIGWEFDKGIEEEFYDLDKDPFQLKSSTADTAALAASRTSYRALKDCSGPSCLLQLPPGVEDGVPAPRPAGDHTAPRVRIKHAPTGWMRTSRPRITYTVSDPDNPTRSLSHWCSHQAIGCNGRATLRVRGEGWQNWTIYVTDRAGNVGSRYGSLGVDLYRPRVGVKGTSNEVVQGRNARLSWRVTDSASGVVDVDVRRRTASLGGDFTPWSYPRTLQNRRTAPRSTGLPPRNGTICLQVRATDRVNRQTAWTGLLCRARTIDAATLGARPAWRTVKREGWYAGTATFTRTRGAALVAPTTGAVGLVRVVARTGPDMGRLRVTVGGRVLGRINLKRVQTGMHEFLLPSRGHAGRVRAIVTTAGMPVWVDSLGVVRRPVG